ncbi:MAG: hypothetical protein AAB468_03275 [Patescibacteria group bacterium]
MIAYAATADQFIDVVTDKIIDPLIILLSAVALLYFLWGLLEMIINADNETGRETGRRHMLYGVIGLAVMLSAYGIMNVICDTLSLSC